MYQTKSRQVEAFFYNPNTIPKSIPNFIINNIIKVSADYLILLVKEGEKIYTMKVPNYHWVVNDRGDLQVVSDSEFNEYFVKE